MRKFLKRIVQWLGTAPVLAVPRKYVDRIVNYYYSTKDVIVSSVYNIPGAPEAFDLIADINKTERKLLLSKFEAYQVYMAVKNTEKIAGDIAEVGVYLGGSAKLICEITKKPVHIFDTFEGLPSVSGMDDPRQFKKGDYPASFESVSSYLKGYPNLHIYQGFFPATAEPIKDKMFSFVHLDVDIYESTLDGLKFFYPRMSRGGTIISHDYPSAKGVKRAFDEFFDGKPEKIIELPGCEQCMVIKI